MENNNKIDEVVEVITSLKLSNQKEVNIDALIDYIKTIPDEQEASRKYEAHSIERLKHESNVSIEMFKSVIQSGQNAMKTALFINAGAAISTLSFISSLFAKDNETYISAFSTSLFIYVLGVLFSASAYGLTYFTQHFYSKNKITRGNIFNIASIGLTISSLVAFFIASWCIYDVMKNI